MRVVALRIVDNFTRNAPAASFRRGKARFSDGKFLPPSPGSLNMIDAPSPAPVVVDVYWRPGCPYCAALRRGLSRRGVSASWHDIWADEDARRFVRAANHGDETVPTVRVGETTLTNPSAAEVARLAGASATDRPRSPSPSREVR